MISIRLRKKSSKKNLIFSIIVVSSKDSPTSGNSIEVIGFYNPLVNSWGNKYVFVDVDKLLYWMTRGAKLNNSVFLLIKPLVTNTIKTLGI